MKHLLKALLLFIAGTTVSSCATVQPYERQFVNDPLMQTDDDAGRAFGNYVYSVREGSTFPSAAKSSGGCGCN